MYFARFVGFGLKNCPLEFEKWFLIIPSSLLYSGMEQIYFLVQQLNCISPRKTVLQDELVSFLDGQWFSLVARN